MRVLAVSDAFRPLAYSYWGEVYPVQDEVIPPSQLTEEEFAVKKRYPNGRWITTKDGRRVFIKDKLSQSKRSALAERFHKPVTAEDARKSEEAKAHVAGALHRQFKTYPTVSYTKADGKNVPHPFDVLGKSGGRVVAIEVKVFTKNTNDKVTVHPPSLLAKLNWARHNGADRDTHTIVRDIRPKELNSGHDWYYRRGVGSFRLGTMTRVQNNQHMRDLISGKAKETGWFEQEG